jgi:hypothetical protein
MLGGQDQLIWKSGEVIMQIIGGFDFFPLTFDDRGMLESRQEFDLLTERANAGPATDAIIIAHGFRNDVGEATALYTRFLETFRTHVSRPEFHGVAGRRFVVAGVYWPSKPFREDYDTGRALTRGVHDDSGAMGDAKAQLDDLQKHDASPDQTSSSSWSSLCSITRRSTRPKACRSSGNGPVRSCWRDSVTRRRGAALGESAACSAP